jgi:lipoprotein signal peptidase
VTEHQRQNFLAIWMFVIILAVDQFIKYKAILSYNYLLNSGLIFGIFKANTAALVISAILFAGALYWIIIKKTALFPLTIVAAALFSNLIDRIVYKGVVDYWPFFKLFWFNLSDLLIVIIVLLALTTFLWTKKTIPHQ